MKRVVCVVCIATCIASPLLAQKPVANEYRFTCRNQADPVSVVTQGDDVYFTVMHKRGISSGTVELVKGNWPKTLRFTFENFRSLEGCHITVGNLKYECFIGFGQQVAKFPLKGVPVDRSKKPLVPDTRGSIETIKVLRKGRNIEIEIPAPPDLTINKTIGISWVDAYRR